MMEEKLTNTEILAVMGKLAASVAHDLNNPLDGSLRFINLALRSVGDNESVREWLNSSKQGLERMENIISSLSEFSRSIHRKQKKAQINKLIMEAMESMSFDFARQRVQVFTYFDQNMPLIESTTLYQVFINLMRNAIDAMPEGGRLDIRTELDGKDTIIKFSDTGEGIKENYIKNVFDSFFTTKIDKKGLGLGLAICKTIVEELGGKIVVSSKVGKGTTFTISIPLKQND
jgi:signal transduction histidine kinase